jgi:DNA polymerase I-like protein with 3'-5' exonuclease and polymerase domains
MWFRAERENNYKKKLERAIEEKCEHAQFAQKALDRLTESNNERNKLLALIKEYDNGVRSVVSRLETSNIEGAVELLRALVNLNGVHTVSRSRRS